MDLLPGLARTADTPYASRKLTSFQFRRSRKIKNGSVISSEATGRIGNLELVGSLIRSS